MIEKERLNGMRSTFEKHFGSAEDLIAARAPGRVNLIGEHTDYNGGYVLPMAIEFDIAVLGRASGGDRMRLFSMDFDESASFVPEELTFDRERQWVNYPKGVMKFLIETGVPVPAVDAVIAGTVPIGGGLSSC